MKARIFGVALAVAVIGASNVLANEWLGGAAQKDGAAQKGAVQKGAVQKGGCGLLSRHCGCSSKGSKCAPAPKCRTPLFARHGGCSGKGAAQKGCAQKSCAQKSCAQKGAVQKCGLGLFSGHKSCGKGAKCAPAPKCHTPLFARHQKCGCDSKGGAAQKCGATQKSSVQKGSVQKGISLGLLRRHHGCTTCSK